MSEVWRLCSSCKKALGFKIKFFECSVSTCNNKRTGLVFCSVACWEVHLPNARHRDAGAIEKISPGPEQWARELSERQAPAAQLSAAGPPARTISGNLAPTSASSTSGSQSASNESRRILIRPSTPTTTNNKEDEVLVVVSRIRQYVKDRADMNTSQEVYDLLSDQLRRALDDMMEAARLDGRKTVMARDFRRKD